MNADPDTTQAVRDWLTEGPDRLPDHVLDAVLGSVPSIGQRPSWQPAWFTSSSLLARGIAIAAAVIVTVVGGVGLVSPAGIGTPAATPSPAPSNQSVPTVAPLATGGPVDQTMTNTVLGAGTYRVALPFLVPFSVVLPNDTRVEFLTAGEAGFATPDGSVELFVPEAVFPDPCQADASPVPLSTADEVTAALSSMVGFTATSSVGTTVDGHPARQFVLTNTIDTATAGCARGLMLPLFTFAGDTDGAATNGGTRQVIWVIDLDGRPFLVLGDGWGDGNRDALRSLVNTIVFD